MQEVVELPRLVSDPQVELLLAHEVVEHHEVGAQDLVHPANRLERVQVVLAGLAVDVGRLAGELGAGRVDRSRRGARSTVVTGSCASHWISRPGTCSAQLRRRWRHRAMRGRARSATRPTARAWARVVLRRPGRPGRRPAGDPIGELAQQAVDLDRVAGGRRVAAAFEPDQLAAGQLGDPLAALERHDLVVGAVDDREAGR